MKQIIYILIFLCSSLVYSQAKKPKTKRKVRTNVVYKKKMVMDFEEQAIDGDYKKPEGFYMIHRATTDFNDIIKFDMRLKDKVKKSVGYLE